MTYDEFEAKAAALDKKIIDNESQVKQAHRVYLRLIRSGETLEIEYSDLEHEYEKSKVSSEPIGEKTHE